MPAGRAVGLRSTISYGRWLRARLAERAYLEKAIGRTGLLALRPLQVTTDRDQWHRYLLRQAG